jgi:hypothetical protein
MKKRRKISNVVGKKFKIMSNVFEINLYYKQYVIKPYLRAAQRNTVSWNLRKVQVVTSSEAFLLQRKAIVSAACIPLSKLLDSRC